MRLIYRDRLGQEAGKVRHAVGDEELAYLTNHDVRLDAVGHAGVVIVGSGKEF
jgi:hypothetical protein